MPAPKQTNNQKKQFGKPTELQPLVDAQGQFGVSPKKRERRRQTEPFWSVVPSLNFRGNHGTFAAAACIYVVVRSGRKRRMGVSAH